MQQRILLSSPYMSGTEKKHVKEAFDTNWIAPLDNKVDEFDKPIKKFTSTKAVCARSSGTGGIHRALDLLGIGQGDFVFCSF